MSELHRRYLFAVKPHHLETLSSYTTRLLAANFEEASHQRYLTKLVQTQNPPMSGDDALAQMVATKTGRDISYMRPSKASQIQHRDMVTCPKCALLLGTRMVCTFCTRGALVFQHAHFLGNVGLKHHRWVGPKTPAPQQVTVNIDVVAAERKFQKLRRQKRIDPPLYFALQQVLSRTMKSRSIENTPSDIALYPQLVAIAGLLTRKGFQYQLFNPNRSFKTAYSALAEAVREQVGSPPEVVRALWLYLRPTFLSLRKSLEDGGVYQAGLQHEFSPAPEVIARMPQLAYPVESFERYLQASGDFELTQENAFEVLVPIPLTLSELDHLYTDVPGLCRRGHRMDRKLSVMQRQTARGEEKCSICSNTTILRGFNDMATTHLTLAEEFSEKNLPLTAADVFAGSSKSYWWTCTNGHEFEATASNRSAAKSGCPVCLHRLIITGVNDAATLYPQLVGEFHPTKNNIYRLETLAPGANVLLWWKCEEGHTFRKTLGNRTRGKGCHFCVRRATQRRTIAKARPDLAAEWHPNNFPLTPDDLTIGSNRKVEWLCPKGHTYVQTPDRRNVNYGCFMCSGKKHIRGVNDAETQYPEICSEWHPSKNCFKEPGDIVPGTALYWWKCKSNEHVTEQSIPNRVKSGGCTECPPPRRIMNYSA